ncbi:MAG: alkyl hydroperoxide reductase subunit F, partial [Bacteroidales bacterium]
MLDIELKNQLKGIFSTLEGKYTLLIKASAGHENYSELVEMLTDFADCSVNIDSKIEEGVALEFTILKDNCETGIIFRAVPGGHEFTSLILAVLNADGKGKNLPDEFTINRIKSLNTPINLTTYMSLSCTNCPDIVQALNIVALLNDGVTHQAVDGSIYEDEVKALNVQAVPTVYA